MITALAGGVGAARLLRGMVEVVPAADITAIVNTGDDTDLHGLHISPDLDTVMYTLADAINTDTGWGLTGESWRVMESLGRLGGVTWFNLGDQDLATHLYRTQRLAEGAPLSRVTGELAASFGVDIGLLPVTDDVLRTRVQLTEGPEVAFQEYFVRLRHDVAVSAVRFEGAEGSTPGPGVLDALDVADLVVVCPSNPVVSIGPLLAVPGVADHLEARRDRVVGVSPIVAGAAIKGPADRLLVEMGFESSAVGVARWYARWVGTLVIDEADAGLAAAVEAEGVRCVVAPTLMTDLDRSAALARTVLGALADAPGGLALYPVGGVGEIRPGDDLGVVLADVLVPPDRSSSPVPGGLVDGDVLVVTQKVVSKAEGRIVAIDADDPAAKRALVEGESVRIVRRRGDLMITETRHGFICANAGVDLSNVEAGTAALLPVDPDRSARRIRETLEHRHGVVVGVIISDTFGRTWRRGVTDVAIGLAGVAGVVDLRGTADATGRILEATEVCIADELAGAADLVMGKDRGIPAAVVRGVDPRWLRPGSVADEIVRPPDEDLFR